MGTHDNPGRRRFILGMPAALLTPPSVSASRPATPLADTASRCAPRADFLDELPVYQGDAGALPALTRLFPRLAFSRANGARLQIANILDPALPTLTTAAHQPRDVGDDYLLQTRPGRHVLPWAPLFPKPTRILAGAPSLEKAFHIGRLFIKDETSERYAVFGNKVRKYEYALPNYSARGARQIRTFGSMGSNHCTFLSLTARLCRYMPAGAERPRVRLGLYPQTLGPAVLKKLAIMQASGADIDLLGGDIETGYEILKQRLRRRWHGRPEVAYFEPGGSNALTLLGHVDAILELAEQIAQKNSAMERAPDVIFVPLGSGATAMGLLLGCYLVGWNTTVVGTCSQDKSTWERLLVNGDAHTPFLVANARHLLQRGVTLLKSFGLESPAIASLDADRLFASQFRHDALTWRPAYGVASRLTRAIAARADAEGMHLDPTFSAKAFTTLATWGRRGRLKQRTALFWSTYHSLDPPGFGNPLLHYGSCTPEQILASLQSEHSHV